MSLAAYLNRLSRDECRAVFQRCCAADVWVDAMLAARPFASDESVLETARRVCTQLRRADWLQAFAAHPRIGDVDSLRMKYANTKAWASSEQAGVQSASDATLYRLAAANQEYLQKFGFIFIVFATGKSAEEMLAILESRLGNNPWDELLVASAEQRKITELRLQKLVRDEQ
jgi:2-oxo-4-hydroxy-4-carboxy-5-ureidoimidazoline decarboxylase